MADFSNRVVAIVFSIEQLDDNPRACLKKHALILKNRAIESIA